MGREKTRTYRASDELYERAMAAANKRGESLGEVIRRALDDYAAPASTARRHPGRRASDRAAAAPVPVRRIGSRRSA